MDLSGESHQRLADAIEARRLDLDLTWKELAARAGISTTTLENIRSGRVPRTRTRRRIEDALGWTHGSINKILTGGEPTLAVESPGPKRRQVPDPLTASADEIIEFLEEIRDVEGDEVYRDLLAQTIEVQRAALRDSRNSMTRKEHEEL